MHPQAISVTVSASWVEKESANRLSQKEAYLIGSR